MLREWYMHPNGQIPAYEWALGDVNPPVHAWAALRVFKIERKRTGSGDLLFLERIFHKLLLNFTWWVNRKDAEGNNLFQGGFLGLDNIGIFDRSAPLPTGGYLEQSDGTSWMAMYTLNMLAIALELAFVNPAYEDVASKFFEHFVHITEAMNNLGRDGYGLWDEEDGFYYDVLTLPDGSHRLLSVVNLQRLRRMLRYLLDENEFLSPYGIRALSRFHLQHPYRLPLDGYELMVDYEPAESTTGLFGGNSNWRGPIWFPINFLLIESMQKFHYFTGDSFQVEFPTGSGTMMNLWDISAEISRRLSRIFLRDEKGRRAVYGGTEKFQSDPHWRDLILFHEYFHGDNGAGLGASHQTGWTGLVCKLLQQSGE